MWAATGLPLPLLRDWRMMRLARLQEANIDWQQASGQEIVLGGLQHPWVSAIEPLLPEFTELTGITVTPQIASETEYVTEIPVTLGGGSPRPDVYMVWSMGQAVAAGWLEPLDAYYENTNLTDPAWYNEEDIFSSARQFPVWPGDGVRYAMAITAEAQTMFYRSDLLEAAGLAVPETFDQLYEAAMAMKTDSVAGIAMRAKPTGDAVSWPAGGFIFSYGGEIVNADGVAVFDSPQAVAAVDMYGKLLRDAGPLGVGTYHWYEALNDYLQGRSAIGGDSSNFAADLEDPEKSTVVGQTLYGALPSDGENPPKPNMWHWLIGMNSQSENKEAAWLFLQWATSAPTSIAIGQNGAAPARASTWEDPDFKARFGEQAAEAALANLSAADSSVMTRAWFHPQSGQILDALAVAVNEVIIGARDAESALRDGAAKANEAIEAGA
jgi:multiple sugar transport system substrate-binding protein